MIKKPLLGSLGLLWLCNCASHKLLIESDPPAGLVYVNDQLLGETPLTVPYSSLPYEENLLLRIEKEDFGKFTALIQGPKLAGLGEKVHVKLSQAPDETAQLNADLERIMQAHKLALEKQYADASRIIAQMIADHPKLVAPRLLEGAIHLMNKDFKKSLESYQQVLVIQASNPEAVRMIEYINSMNSKTGAKVKE